MPSSPRQPIVVLLSGGLDSTVALHWAARRYEVMMAISFDYGSNHTAQELECARWQAGLLNIPHCIIDLTQLSRYLNSALLNGADSIPTGSYEESNMLQTVVPFRNGIFLSIAAGIAASSHCEAILIAAHSGDHALYPDCTEAFMDAMGQAIEKGTYERLQILRPLIATDKEGIVELGVQLNVDFSHTYSCYQGKENHCGVCTTCQERREAFVKTHTPDPTVYDN